MADAARTRLRRAGVVAGATLASRILGFVRDMVVAMALGAGPAADVFFVAFRVPEATRRMLAEGAFSMAAGPALAQAHGSGGPDAMFRLGRSLLCWAGLVLAPLTLLGMAHAGGLVRLLAPGLGNDGAHVDGAAQLLAICLPYLPITVVAGICISMLHVLGRFLTPALSPCVLNVTLILAAGVGAALGLNVALCLAGGLLVAGGAQVWMQLPSLRAAGFTWRGPAPMRSPALARVGREMVPAMLGASAFQIMLMLASFRGASLGVGTVSALYYADRLLQFPLGLAGVAISTVALPELAALHARGEHAGFEGALRGALRLSLLMALPAAAGLWMLAQPVVAVLFGRGEFGEAGVLLTTTMLRWFALALPALALARPLLAATYARGRHRLAVYAGGLGVAAFLAAEGSLEWVAGQHTPAMALVCGAWAMALLLAWGNTWRATREDILWLIRVAAAGLVMAGGIALAETILQPPSWVRVACIPVWATVFCLGATALRVPEALLLTRALARRLRRAR